MTWKLLNYGKSNEELKRNQHKDCEIRVGNAYQADIPDKPITISSEEDNCEDEEVLVWNPSEIPEERTVAFLETINRQTTGHTSTTQSIENSALCEESALFLLHMSDYDINEALMRQRFAPHIIKFECSWSEFERSAFDKGLERYGKNFHAIKKLLPCRSVKDVVDYYYAWKTKKMRKSRNRTLRMLAQ